jgi:hypothetical protein
VASIATEVESSGVATNTEELFLRVRAYLSVWRIGGAEWLEDCAREIADHAAKRLAVEPGATAELIAIDEADAFLRDWFGTVDRANQQNHDSRGVPLETRIALAFGSPPGDEVRFADRTQVIAALRQGELNAACAFAPSRPPETRAMVMQTSLSRLPSIQLIGGWCLLIALLVLAFFLTH